MSNRTILKMLRTQADKLALEILNARSLAGNVDKVTWEELHTEIIRRSATDGVCISVSARCFEGYITIYPNGDVKLEDDDNHLQQIVDQVSLAQWIKYTFKLTRRRI